MQVSDSISQIQIGLKPFFRSAKRSVGRLSRHCRECGDCSHASSNNLAIPAESQIFSTARRTAISRFSQASPVSLFA
ncbi:MULTISPECIES: hypothetical protein, partial [Mesorhizobium]|uniref:hypothetical protein n=1 Tax=Mesorhizobium TaxID=68287 RepID=UPI001AEEA396